MIDRGAIERIFETARIVDVVEEFVSLKRRGVNFIGCCPFHNEKTPSFVVSPAKNIYKCFGCGKAGNPVNFIMEHEQASYPEALRFLAKKYNIEIVEKEQTVEEQQLHDRRESLTVVSVYAARIFQENLHNSREGTAIGMSYFKERGFREDIIKKFELGYSFEARDAFTKKALQDGYKEEFLVETGLSIKGETAVFDRFSGRIIFPIHSLSGKIIAFGGRVLKADKKTAKYLNSPESEIYHKSQVLYGIYQAKTSILKAKKCFLVEGYTDVISMHQAGIEHVVASSGTALTVEQIRLIKRFTNNITVLYDGDAAGIKASLRGIDLILQEDMNVKVLLLPDGEDPDSFSHKRSANELEEYFTANETDFIHFKSKLLLSDVQSDPIKRGQLISDVVESVSLIPNAIQRAVYLKEAAKMFAMDEQILTKIAEEKRQKRASDQYRRENRNPDTDTPETPAKTAKPEDQRIIDADAEGQILYTFEQEIIRLLVNYGNHILCPMNEETGETEVTVAGYLTNELRLDELELQQPELRNIFEEYEQHVKSAGVVDDRVFTHHANPEVSRLVAGLIAPKYVLSTMYKDADTKSEEQNLWKIIPNKLLAYKNKRIMLLLKERAFSMQQAMEKNDMALYEELYAEYSALSDLKKQLAKVLGGRTFGR
jgi:DNA primase